MMQMVHSRFNALLSACVLSLIATASWSQPLTWLGTLGGIESWADGVSANGVVVGWALNGAGYGRAFRWENGVMQDLGTLGGNRSGARGVSADGAVVVGWAENAAGQYRAFRWTASGGMQDLGTLPGGDWSEAYGVSADGSVVVGRAWNGGQWRAFRWQNGVMQDLGTLPGYNWSYASGVSADGRVVVGWAENDAWQGRAFRWQNGVMQNLGTLGGNSSMAYGVSADGAVVVGYAYNSAGQRRAFRWQNGVMQDLGTLRGNESMAYGVSADGSVVVGTSDGGAFRWMASPGRMENLNSTYDIWLTPGSVLQIAFAISPDGRYIVGWGYNAATGRRQAFLLDTRPPCTALDGDVNGDGIVDDADLLIVLFNFGNRYR